MNALKRFSIDGISVSTVKKSDVRGPVPIGCAYGDHDHQRHSPCSFPMLTVARLFDRRSRLCGSLLISLSANLCNTETILWSPDRGISRSRGATRSSESMFERWEKEWKCCGEIRRERRYSHGLSNLKRITIVVSTMVDTYIDCIVIMINNAKQQ